MGGHIVLGGDNVPPLVEIGLTGSFSFDCCSKCSVITVNLSLHFCIVWQNTCPCYSKKTVIQFYNLNLCLHCDFTAYICSVCEPDKLGISKYSISPLCNDAL